MSSSELAVREQPGELTVAEVKSQVNKIQELMRAEMTEGEHFGVIPGTGTKPTLLKSGAEKLCLMFRLDPEYKLEKDWEGEHLTITATCTLYHIPTGNRVASGVAMCSTREAKYAWRKAERICPKCNAAAIIKGKEAYGGGWLCWRNHKTNPGCGAKFADGDQAIEGQPTDRIPNEDLPDTYNTVAKMACKRALTAATLNATAASDIFTQDLEENVSSAEAKPEPTPSGPVEGEIVAEAPDGRRLVMDSSGGGVRVEPTGEEALWEPVVGGDAEDIPFGEGLELDHIGRLMAVLQEAQELGVPGFAASTVMRRAKKTWGDQIKAISDINPEQAQKIIEGYERARDKKLEGQS